MKRYIGAEPMVVYNLTLHAPTDDMILWGKAQRIVGSALFSEDGLDDIQHPRPEIIFSEKLCREVPAYMEDFQVRDFAEEIIGQLPKDAKYVLIGGLTDLCFHLISICHRENITVFTTVTKRERDGSDRFVFHFEGLREICKPFEVEPFCE